MEQLRGTWTGLGRRNQLVAGLAAIGVFVTILALSRFATAPNFTLLYSGLDPAAAGEVIAELEQRGIAHDVRGDAIYVDRVQRDRLRIALAAEGLPANGSAGYELLDSLSGFGTTSQMFDAAYWRAKEGELARTIVASPAIRSARVHISNPRSRPFDTQTTTSASVVLIPARGQISQQQAEALRYLVASAVANLDAGDVAIIDGATGMLLTDGDNLSAAGSEADRSDALRQRVMRLMEARVGSGNAVVEVNVETVMDEETIVERRFDPESRVAISTETTETASNSTRSGNGPVTVASNLPDGDAAENGQNGSSANDTETRERINYEVSETRREVQRGPGAVKRVTVAVLVNGLQATNDAGEEVWQERGQQELAALEDLVKSTIGFDASRGDTVTIRSMAMAEPSLLGERAESGESFLDQLDAMSLIQLAVFAIVALILGLLVVRPILTNPARLAGPQDPRFGLPAPEQEGQTDLPTLSKAPDIVPAPEPEPIELQKVDDLPQLNFASANPPLPGGLPTMGSAFDTPSQPAELPEDPVERLRQLIKDRQEETLEVLRGWIDDEEEHA